MLGSPLMDCHTIIENDLVHDNDLVASREAVHRLGFANSIITLKHGPGARG